ncbi:MAG: glutamine-hydrolyzing carbamoyl-phosphate synthase small subunit [Coriobacteriia bacterium]|nr:glutamine-hydrolyzing carbamoyl-phosphate synthase small subunit [Coriobacteriia bacterium]
MTYPALDQAPWPDTRPARLALADGLVFEGWACGAEGEAAGEVCFNTAMTGYQEILTDPSYRGQIVTLTVPQIGNYGITATDNESRGCFCSGLVVRQMCAAPSNFAAESSVPDWLREQGVVAISGVDTRLLVTHIREQGATMAVISTDASINTAELVARAQAAAPLTGRDLVCEVAYGTPYQVTTDASKPYRVVAIDAGIKFNILRNLSALGCEVRVLPPTATAADIRALDPDGLFLSNGPGDPEPVGYLYRTVAELIGELPIFGICLGHQMLSLAVGAKTYKLKYGHHGGNHPVKNLLTGAVEITAQNHGFCVDFDSIGDKMGSGTVLSSDDKTVPDPILSAPIVTSAKHGRVQLTHLNLNDMTVEGIRLLDKQAFSVQYHPEAGPGPSDAHYLFKDFLALMAARRPASGPFTDADTPAALKESEVAYAAA